MKEAKHLMKFGAITEAKTIQVNSQTPTLFNLISSSVIKPNQETNLLRSGWSNHRKYNF
jgi:hypothetical protein